MINVIFKGRPFKGASTKAFELLENMSSADLARCVPYIKIYEVDPSTRKEREGVRPFMLDLIEPPRFGEPSPLSERPLVSLEQVAIQSDLSYGLLNFNKITIDFVVHRLDEVFSGGEESTVWRSILREGSLIAMEYGWRSDLVSDGSHDYSLFDGQGYFDQKTGVVVPALKSVLVKVYTYTMSFTQDGQAKFHVEALENSNNAFRDVTVYESLGIGVPKGFESDKDNAEVVYQGQKMKTREFTEAVAQGIVKNLDQLPLKVRKDGERLIRFDDAFKLFVEPFSQTIEKMGYGESWIYVGNLNDSAPRQSKQCDGQPMAGGWLADVLLPLKEVKERLIGSLVGGSQLTLYNFLECVVGTLNSDSVWDTDAVSNGHFDVLLKPEAKCITSCVKNADGTIGLVLQVVDFNDAKRPFKGEDALYAQEMTHEQTQEKVMTKLKERDVPVMRIGHALSYISDASFDFNLDEDQRMVFLDQAYRERKSRLEIAGAPDPNGRVGKSNPEDFVLMSCVKGTVTMVGNFVAGLFGQLWLDFYGLSQMSGLFYVTERSDAIGPGKFETKVTLVTDGSDPLNTRRKLSRARILELDEEKRAAEEKIVKERQKKKK